MSKAGFSELESKGVKGGADGVEKYLVEDTGSQGSTRPTEIVILQGGI